MRLFRIVACVVPLLIASASAQDEIKVRQAELNSIRDQIKEFEAKIREQQSNERATLELLDSYDKKATLVRRLITHLRGQEQDIQRRIEETRHGMTTLGAQLEFLKKHYAAYVTSVYRAGRTRDMELLLSSSSINQFTIRNEYLKRFTEQRKRDAARIAGKRRQVEDIQARLHIDLSEEQRLISEKGAEEGQLAELSADRRSALAKLRKDRKLVQREIDRKMKAARDLEGMISQLIEADRLKKEREEEQARKLRIPAPVNPVTGGGFEHKKGKLRWPVTEGRIVGRFGNQKHPTLKTVTQNTGIDIAVESGTAVTSVADGEVATIWWLPSYGNLVIVNHSGGYRTVYTHLAEIRVGEGTKLKEGDLLGFSGEALEGPRLHFELWKDREKQNPEQWLGRP